MTFDQLFQFAGRLHPMLLHAPLGVLIALLLVEALALVRRKPLAPETRSSLAWFAAVSAAASAVTGFVLSYESGYGGDTLQLHQWLGISVAAAAVMMAIAQQKRRLGAYTALLLLTCGLMFPAGHLGATITHGANFLFEPFGERPAPRERAGSGIASTGEAGVVGTGAPRASDPPLNASGAGPSVFAQHIAPILEAKCISCHGSDKARGGLALHTREAIMAGGDVGPVVVPGDAAASELVFRLKLPIDDDDHMPPDGKAQLTTEEIAAIERWIADGASFEQRAPSPGVAEQGANGAPPAIGPRSTPPKSSSSIAPPAASPQAIASLRQALVHVEPVARDSTLLVVDASAVAKSIGDEQIRTLLEPLGANIADLNLARTQITDGTLKIVSKMPALRRLNLTATRISDDGLAALAKHPSLEELILAQTTLSDRIADTLASLPALKRVYLWHSQFTTAALEDLRRRMPRATVDTGDASTAATLETESTVTLTDPGRSASTVPPSASADALKPSNTACPVSGKPIDANFAIVYKGRVVAFCCRHCLGQFLEDPAKFEHKID